MAKATNTPNKNSRSHSKGNDLHNLDIKSESEYTKGAKDEVGQDVRKSREKAIDFQKNRAIDK